MTPTQSTVLSSGTFACAIEQKPTRALLCYKEKLTYYTVKTCERYLCRFDGLLEKEWLEWRNLNFESNLRAFSDIPSELTPEQEDALRNKIAERAGVEPSMLRDK